MKKINGKSRFVSFRLDRDIHKALFEAAASQNKTISQDARDRIVASLEDHESIRMRDEIVRLRAEMLGVGKRLDDMNKTLAAFREDFDHAVRRTAPPKPH